MDKSTQKDIKIALNKIAGRCGMIKSIKIKERLETLKEDEEHFIRSQPTFDKQLREDINVLLEQLVIVANLLNNNK